jgi:ribonuclease-3
VTRPNEVLCRHLGYQFNRQALLETALTHRSMGANNNERLEFLGDAILSYVITGALFDKYPKAKEGELSRYRASLVKGETLAAIARDFEIGDFVHLGPGELKSGGFRRESILANTLEAIIGAIYLDGGLPAATDFILSVFQDRLEAIKSVKTLKDPKTRLQEYLQAKGLPLPEYTVTNITGRNHAQTFKVACSIATLDEMFVGQGSSRRKAEQASAKKALELIQQNELPRNE